MLHYVDLLSKAEIAKMKRRLVCFVCGGELWEYYDPTTNREFLACWDNWAHGDKSHEGFA